MSEKKSLMKSIEFIRDEITKDSKIDRDNLDVELLNIPYQYGKWINIHSIEKAYLSKFMKQLTKLKPLKFDYYKGNENVDYMNGRISPTSYTKTQAIEKVNSDDEICILTDKIEIQELKVDMITEFLKGVTSKGWNIRTAVDYIKFKNGI